VKKVPKRQLTPKSNHMHQDRDLSEPERRCIATGQNFKKAELIRFVVSPDGVLVPDFQNKLPGRGIWIGCQKKNLELALKKGLFSRAARRKLDLPDDFISRVEKGLRARCLNLLGLTRKSGKITTGFAKVEAALKSGKAVLLLAANDSAEDGRRKLRRLAERVPIVQLFGIEELSQALGQENVVHACLSTHGQAQKFLVEVSRLESFVNQDDEGERTGSE
jgi:uncharacterized protein